MSEEGTAIPGEENIDTSGAVLSTEDRAIAVGWHDKGEGGLSAEDFLSKRDDHNGLLRGDIKKLEAKLAGSDATMKAMAGWLEKNRSDGQIQGYNKAIAEEKERMKVAVNESDGEAYEIAAKRADQLQEQRDNLKPEKIVPDAPEVNPLEALVRSHQDANPTLFDNSAKAQTWETELRYQGNRPGVTFEEAVKSADALVRQQHFQTRPNLGPTGGETADGNVSEFNSLPADAKAAYKQFHEANPNFTKEAYLLSYNS